MIEAMAAAPSHLEPGAGYRNMQQLIQLRWIAVVGQITTIATVTLDGVALDLPEPREQAEEDALWAQLNDVIQKDLWPRHLYFGGL